MKKFISSLSLIAAGLSAWAGMLTPQEALDRAMNSASDKVFARPKFDKSAMRHVATRKADGLPAVYVFCRADAGGYLIVSAEDGSQPLLGYGEETDFDAADINPTMEWWLDEYAAQIKWIRENGVNINVAAAVPDRPAIEPMVSTRWDQDEPYNYQCPTYSGIGYMHCPTGCAATAMAQLLYYHRYSTTAFDWGNMLESYSGSYTDAQRNAVAKLMAECGSASRTVYNSYGSSANAQDIMNGFVTLGYDKYVANPYMNNYSIKDWNDLVYEQLRDFGPTIVLGFYGRSGHAFICDGYDGNGYFHINWGWGGRSDGYFTLTAMTPEEQGSGGSNGGYNSNVSLIANICPSTLNVAPNFFLASGKWSTKVSEIALGEEFSINCTIQNRNNGSFSGAFGYKLVDEKTGTEFYHTINESVWIWDRSSKSGLQAIIPADVSEGDYRMYLVWRVQNSDEWKEVPVFNYYSPYINVHVEGDMAYFSEAKGVDLSLEIEAFESPFFLGCDFNLKANVVNKGIGDYNSVVYVVLFGEDGTTKYAYGSNHSLLLLSGEGTDFEYTSKFSNFRNMTVEPGKYRLAFVDNYDAIISDLYPIEIQEKPDTSQAEIEVLEDGTAFVGDKDKADKNNIDIAVNVKSNGGYFIGQIWAEFFEEGANSTENILYSKTLFIPQDESQLIHIKGAIPALKSGKNYEIELYSKKGKLAGPIATVYVDDSTTGIDMTEIEKADIISRELFTLTGTRVSVDQAGKGIYIERVTYADGTVVSHKRLIK